MDQIVKQLLFCGCGLNLPLRLFFGMLDEVDEVGGAFDAEEFLNFFQEC